VWFVVHTAVLIKIQVLWDVMLCQLLNSGWCYGGISHSEILVTIYHMTWLYFLEDFNLHFISYSIIAQFMEFLLVMTMNEKNS